MIYEKILKEKMRLEKQVNDLQSQIEELPAGKLFYWEHFGLMNQPTYRKNACSKLQFYISNGIIPDIQLITTYETQEEPLDPETVEKIVQHYFL